MKICEGLDIDMVGTDVHINGVGIRTTRTAEGHPLVSITDVIRAVSGLAQNDATKTWLRLLSHGEVRHVPKCASIMLV